MVAWAQAYVLALSFKHFELVTYLTSLGLNLLISKMELVVFITAVVRIKWELQKMLTHNMQYIVSYY